MCTNFRLGSLIAVFTVLALLLACKGDTGPAGPAGTNGRSKIDISGYVRDISPGANDATAYLDVFGTGSRATVTINGTRLDYSLYGNTYFSSTSLPITAGDTANLVVMYKDSDGVDATARATVVMPSPFEIISHDTSVAYDVTAGTGLTVTWAPSNNFDTYRVYEYFYYSYRDTGGEYNGYSFSNDTILSATSLVLSPSHLFPRLNEIDSITYGYGYVDVYAISGPCHEGDMGNVTGDGTGLINGVIYGGTLPMRFGEVTTSSIPPRRDFRWTPLLSKAKQD